MTLRPLLVPVILLLGSACQAAAFNGRVQGAFDGRDIDVPMVCERPTLAGQTGRWFYAQSDPPTHEYAEDRNGDGVAVSVSFTGDDAKFMLFVNGQDYNFGNTRRDQITVTKDGFVLTTTASRYEGKGKARRKVGDQEIRLAVDCPRP